MKKRIIERHMFYGAKKNTFSKAAALRENMTKAENVLWKELKNKSIFKARWKPQHPIDIFIVDFYCHKYRLAIEVDGDIHINEEIREHDEAREYEIKRMGVKILRFSNEDIFNEIESVKNRILEELSENSEANIPL